MNESTTVKPKIYLGSRGDDFKQLITNLLERSKLKPKYINSLIGEKGMKAYGMAFTAASANHIDNYERFEQIGDLTANKFVVWYAYKRFPQLDCTKGVKIVARLRINYGSKEFFAQIAEELGFWDYISAVEENYVEKSNMKCRNNHKKDLLEDTFEAFIGCTEYLLDDAYRIGVGYGIVYDLLKNIFEKIPMSLEYDDLYDAKTRLKETFDVFKDKLGVMRFIDTRKEINPGSGHFLIVSTVYRVPVSVDARPLKDQYDQEMARKDWIKLGQGQSTRKADAQNKAAEISLDILRRDEYYRRPPPEYEMFCQN